jgi:hypothetical protein
LRRKGEQIFGGYLRGAHAVLTRGQGDALIRGFLQTRGILAVGLQEHPEAFAEEHHLDLHALPAKDFQDVVDVVKELVPSRGSRSVQLEHHLVLGFLCGLRRLRYGRQRDHSQKSHRQQSAFGHKLVP